MVSTRGVRYKFSEGERVLCYEPDPTKAKVLYDSKVLEVVESKDKRGRRTVEYLIHFQGWNSSWDRCVSEDFVLKDTEENRQLQRDLAEKSQLQLGAYLYRRERKKGSANSSSGAAKRPRHGFSDDGSSSSTQPEDAEGAGESDSSSGSGSGSQPNSPPPPQPGRANITLPSQLRDRLTFDFHLVVKRGKLSKLPATPSAAEILESFVKWYARAGAWHPTRGRHDPPQRPDMLDVSRRLNLVREVADSLRVYFDFILRGHLLYKQELNQYHDVCGQYIDIHEEMISKTSQDDAFDSLLADMKNMEPLHAMKSPGGISEYAHLPPFSEDERNGEKNAIKIENQGAIFGLPKMEVDIKVENKVVKKEYCDTADAAAISQPVNNVNNNVGKGKDVKTVAPRAGTVARRLRSHKSVVSQGDIEEPTPSTSAVEPRTFETMSSSFGSSGSSLSESFSRPTQAQAAPATTRTPLSLLLDKVAKWQIIPRDGTEHLPCRVYGAIHLARLFVKLPDFLNAITMSDYKLKLILKHIDMFIQYLDEHSEWFGEGYYLSESMSRSH